MIKNHEVSKNVIVTCKKKNIKQHYYTAIFNFYNNYTTKI